MHLLLFATWVCIFCGKFADSQHEIDISVNGENVVKTNTTTYTIVNPKETEERTVTISCLSLVKASSKISILRNDTVLNSNYTTRVAAAKFMYNKSTVKKIRGVYSCMFTYSNNASKYSIVRKVIINTISETLCASSNGFFGYVGERVTLVCHHKYDVELQGTFYQAELLESSYLQVHLFENNTYECAIKQDRSRVCSENFFMYPTLTVEISPKTFTPSFPALTFSCESTPFRLLYWKVIGDGGNFLDLTKFGHLHATLGVNITIQQEAGTSHLRIFSPVSMEEKNITIHRVECYVPGTRFHDISNVKNEVTHETRRYEKITTVRTTTTNETAGTSRQTNNNAERTSTINFTMSGSPPDEQNPDPTKNGSNVQQSDQRDSTNKDEDISIITIRELILLMIASVEAVILVILVIILWTYCKCRTEENKLLSQDEVIRIISSETEIPSSQRGLTDNIIPPETKLHTNPVYQSYD